MKRALLKALESGETDLVYLVLLHMKEKMEPRLLFNIINSPSFVTARKLLITYCKEQDLDFLKIFFQSLELPHESAAMHVLETFKVSDLPTKRKLLVQARDLYSTSDDYYVETKVNFFHKKF